MLFLVSSFFIFNGSFAQNRIVSYKIEGQVKPSVTDKYVYLYLNNSKRLMKSSINTGQFMFSGLDTLDKKGLSFGELFLSNDSTDRYIPFKEIRLKHINRKYKSIVLENIPVKVIVDGSITNARVDGGKLNKIFDEMNNAIAAGQYENFIEKYYDSPMSLTLIRALLSVEKMNRFNLDVSCQSLYNKLSDKIKQSEYGQEVQKKIKEL